MAPRAPAARRPRPPGRPRAAPRSPRSHGPPGGRAGRGDAGGTEEGTCGGGGTESGTCGGEGRRRLELPRPGAGKWLLQTEDWVSRVQTWGPSRFSGPVGLEQSGVQTSFRGSGLGMTSRAEPGKPSSRASETCRNRTEPPPCACWVPGGVNVSVCVCLCRERIERG